MSSKRPEKSGRPKPTKPEPTMLKPGSSGTAIRLGQTDLERSQARRALTSMAEFKAKAGSGAAEIGARAQLPQPAEAAAGKFQASTIRVDAGAAETDAAVATPESTADGAAITESRAVDGAVGAVAPGEIVAREVLPQPTEDSAAAITAVSPEEPPDATGKPTEVGAAVGEAVPPVAVPEAGNSGSALDGSAPALALAPASYADKVAGIEDAGRHTEVVANELSEIPNTGQLTVWASEDKAHPAAPKSDLDSVLLSFSGEIHEFGITTVDAFAAKISTAWHRSVEATLVAARSCAMANYYLTSDQKRELIAKLPFGLETFSKLVKIGHDPRMQASEIKQLLPPHYTTIYPDHGLG